MRSVWKFAVTAAVAVVVAAAAFAISLRIGITRPAGDESSPAVRVEVPHGQAFSVLVNRLSDEGLISSPWAVRFFASESSYASFCCLTSSNHSRT